jgi:hypothetical protein
MMSENQLNEFKGFSLFNDQEDPLRTRNRAVVLTNIAEDYSDKKGNITPKGASIMLGYFSKIPAEERAATKDKFVIEMTARGFKIE